MRVLRAVEARAGGFRLETEEFSVGAGEYLKSGHPLPESVFERLAEFHAILLGAMGLPDVRWPDGVEMTPQLDLRERLDLYQGLRPIYLFHPDDSPLRGRAGRRHRFLAGPGKHRRALLHAARCRAIRRRIVPPTRC